MFRAAVNRVDKIHQMPVEPVKKTDVEEEEEDDEEEYEGEDTGEYEVDEEDIENEDERRNRIETEKILGRLCLKKIPHMGDTESIDVSGK